MMLAQPGRSTGRRWRIDRALLVLVHRWTGLVLAGFLLLAGLTGSLLAWNNELEAAFSPDLFIAPPPSADAVMLDPLVLRERVQAAYPQALAARVSLETRPGRSSLFRLSPRQDVGNGPAAELPNDQVFVNPYTGAVLGERKWGDISQGMKNLMPFIYRLHYTLALGTVGSYVLGIVALLWTLDCFVGAYLTFPALQHRQERQRSAAASVTAAGGPSRKPAKSWFARWWPSWKVRWRGGAYKLKLDLHRAGGLWPWAMLFVLAWSGVGFNLTTVYDPVMKALFAHQSEDAGLSEPGRPGLSPVIDWEAARDTGRRIMAKQAQAHGFTVLGEDMLVHDPSQGVYRYVVRSNRDILDQGGWTSVAFDADTGELKSLWLPTGAASGDTVRTWLTSLHMAIVWGLPFKTCMTLLGLGVAMLSVTGVLIWRKKWQGRHRLLERNALMPAAASAPSASGKSG